MPEQSSPPTSEAQDAPPEQPARVTTLAAEEGVLLGARYRLGPLIGRGGMARVYRAFDERLGRHVAVKMLVAAAVSDRRRFEAEVRTLARLDHPNLVRVLDAGTEGDSEYLVMELVEGTNLAERGRREPLGSAEVAHVGGGVAAALAYVHGQGFVHRDVKPANILLGDDGRPKLADFGIARAVGSAGATQTGLTIGTPAYLAPEQLTDASVVGPPADVYALGLVLHECLTGRPVFEGSAAEVSAARLHRDPEIADTIPADWSILLRTMTARSPAARPTAAEVSAYLESLATAEAKRALAGAGAAAAAAAGAELPLLPTLQIENPFRTEEESIPASGGPRRRGAAGRWAAEPRRLAAVLLPALFAGALVGWLLSSASSGGRPEGSASAATLTGRPALSTAASDFVGSVVRAERAHTVSVTAARQLLAFVAPIGLTPAADHQRERGLFHLLLATYYQQVSSGGISPAAMPPLATSIVDLGRSLGLKTASLQLTTTTTSTTTTTTQAAATTAPPGNGDQPGGPGQGGGPPPGHGHGQSGQDG